MNNSQAKTRVTAKLEKWDNSLHSSAWKAKFVEMLSIQGLITDEGNVFGRE